jgi:hypothetical protein
MGWWKEEHFKAADMDGDGLLNLTEFNEYVFQPSPKLVYLVISILIVAALLLVSFIILLLRLLFFRSLT